MATGFETEVNKLIRTWMEQYQLAAATASYDVGPSYFSAHGQRSSNIDHILSPDAALPLINKFSAHRLLLNRLQLVAVERPHDHAPIIMRIAADLQRHSEPPYPQIDGDLIMKASLTGKQQHSTWIPRRNTSATLATWSRKHALKDRRRT